MKICIGITVRQGLLALVDYKHQLPGRECGIFVCAGSSLNLTDFLWNLSNSLDDSVKSKMAMPEGLLPSKPT